MKDMPKLKSPFVRIRNESARGYKAPYICTPEIAAGFEWVFNDNEVIATEKLDGTNVSVYIENGTIKKIWNRVTEITFFNKGRREIIEGVYNAYERGYVDGLPDGQYFGECIGPRINGNNLELQNHIWLPFDSYVRNKLAYTSWGEYPKTFETISKWFEHDLFSLYYRKTHSGKKKFSEGIVFVKPSTGQMAKLRRDMFDWYVGMRHKE